MEAETQSIRMELAEMTKALKMTDLVTDSRELFTVIHKYKLSPLDPTGGLPAIPQMKIRGGAAGLKYLEVRRGTVWCGKSVGQISIRFRACLGALGPPGRYDPYRRGVGYRG